MVYCDVNFIRRDVSCICRNASFINRNANLKCSDVILIYRDVSFICCDVSVMNRVDWCIKKQCHRSHHDTSYLQHDVLNSHRDV